VTQLFIFASIKCEDRIKIKKDYVGRKYEKDEEGD
jgi:hypothetical protein